MGKGKQLHNSIGLNNLSSNYIRISTVFEATRTKTDVILDKISESRNKN